MNNFDIVSEERVNVAELADSFIVIEPVDVIGLDEITSGQISNVKSLVEIDFENFIKNLLNNNPYGLKELFDFFKNNLDFSADSFQHKILVSSSVGLVANE